MIANQGASKLVAVSKLVEHPRNVNEGDVGAIHQSITHNGFYGALVVQQSTGYVLVGNHRLRAAKAAGLDRLPVFYVDVDDERALKIMLADNRTGELASRDEAALAALLTEIAAGSGLDGTGYDGDDLDELLGDLNRDPTDPAPRIDEADTLLAQWGVSAGQLWIAGAHRIVCGDARDVAVLEQMIGGGRVDVLLTDPPYGIDLDTDYSPIKGSPKAIKGLPAGRRYRPVIGDDEAFDPRPVAAFFAGTQEQFWFGADYYRRLLSDDDRDGSWLVWDKRNEDADAVIGSGFELVWSRKRHKRDLLRHYYTGAFGADASNRSHPTQKPVPMLREIIARWSQPGATVADPYLGVGSVIVACQEEGRVGCGVEIDPAYVAVTLQRLHDMGLTPVLQ